MEIGCNDGILLNHYPKNFNNVLGVEPSDASKHIKKKRIKDVLIHQRICNEISEWFETIHYSKVLNIIESPIKGPKGNVEFLITVKFQK